MKQPATTELKELQAIWSARWEEALGLWSSFIRLKEPVFCRDSHEAEQAGLQESFAQIDLYNHQVVIGLDRIHALGLDDYPLEILGHEIGHHLLCPANLTDHGRMLAIMRLNLPSLEYQAGLVANLYSDLLINDRLFREHRLRMDQVYEKIRQDTHDPLWKYYMRCYEILWELAPGSLTDFQPEIDLDARLTYRIIRNSIQDFLRNAGTFASLCLKYLLERQEAAPGLSLLSDAVRVGPPDIIPDGLTAIGEAEAGEQPEGQKPGPSVQSSADSRGQYRDPFEYGEILRAMGVKLDEEEIAARYYRERALPHLIPYPRRKSEQVSDPLPEGLEIWESGDAVSDLNILESLFRSPVLIPGYTTLQRTYGTEQGTDRERIPLDLDLYVDSSGSMPDPRSEVSYLTLAGCIIALSALRAGASVQVTLWSGTDEFLITDGFVRSERDIIRVLTGFFGNGTAFPIHVLRETYRVPRTRPAHILIISDEGVDTLYAMDEKGNEGYQIAEQALSHARGGGSMVLNLWQPWQQIPALVRAAEQGWNIYPISGWEQLVAFSRAFVRRNYQETEQ